jgi:hypothetical protein
VPDETEDEGLNEGGDQDDNDESMLEAEDEQPEEEIDEPPDQDLVQPLESIKDPWAIFSMMSLKEYLALIARLMSLYNQIVSSRNAVVIPRLSLACHLNGSLMRFFVNCATRLIEMSFGFVICRQTQQSIHAARLSGRLSTPCRWKSAHLTSTKSKRPIIEACVSF